jgi:uncharacterized protein (DUF934 family)
MRYILRPHELLPDDWCYLGEPGAAAADTHALIVPLAELRRYPGTWTRRSGRLGVRLAPVDEVETLADLVPALSLVALEFPAGDGRGYSQARLLRQRLRFSGELRAVGAAVRQDQVFLMARCGFDALELAPGEDLEACRRALERYRVGYQPGAAQVPLSRQRFRA